MLWKDPVVGEAVVLCVVCVLVAICSVVPVCCAVFTMGFTPEGPLPLFFFKKGLVEVDFDA